MAVCFSLPDGCSQADAFVWHDFLLWGDLNNHFPQLRYSESRRAFSPSFASAAAMLLRQALKDDGPMRAKVERLGRVGGLRVFSILRFIVTHV